MDARGAPGHKPRKIRGPRIWSTGSRLVGPPLAWALRGERGYLIKTPEEFVSKSGRNLDAAAIEYLYRLYITEVIPPRPHLKIEGIELAADVSVVTSLSSRDQSRTANRRTVVPELEKQGRCNF